MKRIYVLAVAAIILISTLYHFTRPKASSVDLVLNQYRKDIAATERQVGYLYKAVKTGAPIELIRSQFKRCREDYKKTEWLAEYYNSYTAKYINGPALREVEEDQKEIVIYPEGFQVIEELIFPAYDTSSMHQLITQVHLLNLNIKRLALQAASLETTDAHIFDALRLEIFRLISLGISGFDSPLARNSISEAASVLESISVYYIYYGKRVYERNKPLDEAIRKHIQSAIAFLRSSHDFNQFDRASFILNYANPLSSYLHTVQKDLAIPFLTEPRPLMAEASTLFAARIFNADFYTPGFSNVSSVAKVKLGQQLFNDKSLSGNGKISCATCHQPAKAFTDGIARSLSINGRDHLKRNAPTLLNAALQGSLFYDSRVVFLEDQANEVLLNKDEMHGSFKKMLTHVHSDTKLKADFQNVFGNQEINEHHIKNAIASFIRSLVGLNSRFDLYMRGDKQAMQKEEIKGFNVFMGKAKCGTCHFVPLFNGTIPPSFNKTEAEVIGVPANTDTINPQLDTDPGKFILYKVPLHKNAFKTPGLRNIALTAPYMHNGVYNTLEEVIDFYDRGGGGGLGFEMENLTLPKEALELSGDEKEALVAFLKCLNDVPLDAGDK